MVTLIDTPHRTIWGVFECIMEVPGTIFLTILLATTALFIVLIPYIFSFLVPIPRAPTASEKTYITSQLSGKINKTYPLPCWHDSWLQHRKAAEENVCYPGKNTGTIEKPEVEMSVVIPAYNEEERLEAMLDEAVSFLDSQYGREPRCKGELDGDMSLKEGEWRGIGGYEIIIVNDASVDKTVDVGLAFSQRRGLHDILRICTLKKNRGKGGAVTHGLRHVRGQFVLFADADGASRFSDLSKLVEGCIEVADECGRAISVGSRAYLVGSEAVVKRSAFRNVLMHSFHILLRLLTPPITSRIRDTQCGFKLLTRPALPHIVPYMHTEGWIFDVEILMLAESAPPAIIGGRSCTEAGINVKEIYIDWKEVGGSKLNVFWDSLGMAYGLALLRAGWTLGVYKRR